MYGQTCSGYICCVDAYRMEKVLIILQVSRSARFADVCITPDSKCYLAWFGRSNASIRDENAFSGPRTLRARVRASEPGLGLVLLRRVLLLQRPRSAPFAQAYRGHRSAASCLWRSVPFSMLRHGMIFASLNLQLINFEWKVFVFWIHDSR